MSALKILVEAAIVVGEYLLNRARPASKPAVKHTAVKDAQDAWNRKVAARKSS